MAKCLNREKCQEFGKAHCAKKRSLGSKSKHPSLSLYYWTVIQCHKYWLNIKSNSSSFKHQSHHNISTLLDLSLDVEVSKPSPVLSFSLGQRDAAVCLITRLSDSKSQLPSGNLKPHSFKPHGIQQKFVLLQSKNYKNVINATRYSNSYFKPNRLNLILFISEAACSKNRNASWTLLMGARFLFHCRGIKYRSVFWDWWKWRMKSYDRNSRHEGMYVVGEHAWMSL